MRLLDPFAGYSLAQGLPVNHIALFIASWVVGHYTDVHSAADLEMIPGDNAADVNEDINQIAFAFGALRYSHLLSAVLSGAAVVFLNYSKLDEDDVKNLEDVQKEEDGSLPPSP